MAAATPPSPRLTWAFSATAAIFFVAGIPALIYQIAWQRSLFLVFGINIESVTMIVTVFMLGLGLGAAGGGLISRQQRVPLLVAFGVIELTIAAFGAVSLSLFDLANGMALANGPVANAMLMSGLLLVPTILMGAGLPILAEFFIAYTGNVGRSVGTLYFANTLGAGFACFLTAILLFPHLGLRAAVLSAAILNLIAGVAAIRVHVMRRRLPPTGSAPARAVGAQVTSPSDGAANNFRLLLVAGIAFASGFLALSHEILLIRVASFASEARASAFALTLGAVLIGIAVGARGAQRLCRRHPDDAGRLMAWLAALIFAAALCGYLSFGLTAHAARWGPPWAGVLMVFAVITFALWGAVLPLAAHIGIRADNRAGLGFGLVYMANVMGSALGAVLTGYVILDRLGIRDAALVLFAAGLCLTLAIAGWRARGRAGERAIETAAGVLAVGVAGLALASFLFDDFHGRLLTKGERATRAPVSRVVENRNSVVVIDQRDRVFGRGVYDGVVSVDLRDDVNGIIRPYSLSLWHAKPRRVLALGLSMGSWAQVLANHPDLETLTIVEINPGYLKLIADYPAVASLLDNPKVTIVIDDARRWMRRNPTRKFDAIVQNTTINDVSYVTYMLSAEYLEIIRRHLLDGGVFLYNATSSARAMKTGCLAFANGFRFFNSLVVGNGPIALDRKRLARVLAAYRIDGHPVLDIGEPTARAKLQRILRLQNVQFGDRVYADDALEPCRDLLARTPDTIPMTDDNMGNEWSR